MRGGASDGIAPIISPTPLGGLVGRCAAAVAVSTAHYRPISSLNHRAPCPCHIVIIILQPLVAVERTCIFELATPLALTP